MATSRTPELHPIARPLARCPHCSSERLEPVVEPLTGSVHFLCSGCGRCWHVELGFVRRMRPGECTGCPQRGRCELADAADYPSL